MSRKDIIKMSLGITEYPWSSDDDLEEASVTIQNQETTLQRPAEAQISVADAPGTSGLQPMSLQQQSQEQREHYQNIRRNQDRSDRAMFWSIINGQYRSNGSQLSTSGQRHNNDGYNIPRVTHTPAPELQSLSERSTALDLRRRVLAVKRLTRRQPGSQRHTRSANTFIPVSRINPGVVVPSEANSSIRLNRESQYRLLNRASSTTFSTRLGIARVSHSARIFRPSNAPRDSRQLDQDEINNNPAPAVAHVISDEDNQDEVDVLGNENTLMNASAEVSREEEDGDVAMIDVEQSGSEQVATDGSEITISPDEPVENPMDDNNRTTVAIPESRRLSNVQELVRQITASTGQNIDTEPTESSPNRRRRRTSENREQFTVKEFNQNLLRLLECPVCLEWMEPPMSQCRRGHLVCGRCRVRLNSCPVCRTTFSSVRNRAMEGVAELLRYPCRHGCGREVRLRRRGPHEANCGARKYQCPAPACSATLPHALLHEHLQSRHMSMIKLGCRHKFSMKVNLEQRTNWLIHAMDEYFHLKIDLDIRTWGVVILVYYIGPECDAKNYIYEVSVNGQHNRRKVTYARSTHSDLESSSLNISRHDCFHLTLDQALNFIRFKNRHCVTEKYLDFNLEIMKAVSAMPRNDSDS